MADAVQIAEAMRRVTSGDQTPPRPWAYLSGLGIVWVGDMTYLNMAGLAGPIEQASFDLNTDDGGQFEITVRRVR